MERARRRARGIAVLVLGVVFVSGLLIGFALDGSLVGESVSGAELPSQEPEVEGRERRPREWEQVDPTPEQLVLIDSIVSEHRRRMKALRDEYEESYEPRFRAIVEETRSAISGVFTPEQAEEYRMRLEERDRRRAAERAEGGE